MWPRSQRAAQLAGALAEREHGEVVRDAAPAPDEGVSRAVERGAGSTNLGSSANFRAGMNILANTVRDALSSSGFGLDVAAPLANLGA